MQCRLRSMSDNASPISDTMPKRGRVNEVCREWLVHEDGALAYQLQKQEVERHLTNNKSRNAIVREDFPKAKDEQKREEIEAIAKYQEQVHAQALRDARVAKELAEEMAREEERKRRLEAEDQRIARQIQFFQEKEKRKPAPALHHQANTAASSVGDINSVGLPLPQEVYIQKTEQQFRAMRLEEVSSGDEGPSNWPPPPTVLELDSVDKTEQEKRDEELARLLQEEEESGLDMVDRDRMLAIEAQDKEFARMLQEKEKAKIRRARERAKQKALAKKQLEEEMAARAGGSGASSPTPPSANLSPSAGLAQEHVHPRHPKPKHRSDEEDDMTLCQAGTSQTLPNIAMAIDPTYTPPRHSTLQHATPPPPAPYIPQEYEEEEEAPPYMPVQGQRRSSSLEKKRKKEKAKESCKQQ